MDALYSPPAHYRVLSSCGLCGDALQPSDPFVALLGHPNLDKIETCSTVPCSFPHDGFKTLQRRTNPEFCRVSPCPLCDASPEAVPLHKECLVLFGRWCASEDALDRLWGFAAARSPWRGAPDLGLPETSSLASHPGPQVAAAAGLAPLATRLPLELVQQIRGLTGPCLFWRYSAAVSAALRLSDESREAAAAATAPEPPVAPVPLARIAEWRRGHRPVVVEEDAAAALPPVIRITVDARGAASIERLAQMAQESGQKSATKAFIVWEASSFRDTAAVFKFGAMRLQFPGGPLAVPIWDTPTPPTPPSCSDLGARPQLCTIELTHSGGARTTGLTFLYFRCRLYGVHAHTAAEPSARATNDRLPTSVRGKTVWVHLPLPEGEEILSMAVQLGPRGKPRFLFRLKLAGLVSLGPNHGEQGSARFTICPSPPKLLYYNKATGTNPTSGIAASPRHSDGQPPGGGQETRPWPPQRYPDLLNGNSYASTVSLEDVRAITVLSNANGGCTGALFEYESGAVAAVGVCRVGEQSQTQVDNPTHITLQNAIAAPAGTGFSFAAHSAPGFDTPQLHAGVQYLPMQGSLAFLFKDHRMVVVVYNPV
ncbi:hypothetical protein RB598_000157 [Gaeumannomyces tritici]